MRATPRYGGPPVIDVADMAFDPLLVVRQRDRLADMLSQLTNDEWAVQSRCDGWSVQDVAEHLAGVNQFWVLSLTAGLRGEPTRLLATFDPNAVPAAMVERARGDAAAITLDRLTASNAELAGLLHSLSDRDLDKLAEAPPGHLTVSGVCAHALWDSWVHERDVLLPLGRKQHIDLDEVAMALAYVAALGPACYLNSGQAQSGSLGVIAHNPSVRFSVRVAARVMVRPDDITLSAASVDGPAVELIDGLSCRTSLPDVSAEDLWLVDGLSKVFSATG